MSTTAAGTPGTSPQPSKARIWLDFSLSLLLAAVIAGVITLLGLPVAHAQGTPEKIELRIGYQKAASLFVLQKAQGTLEKRLQPLNATVKWVEFPAGPQLLEGLNLGSVDVGYVGEAPPIFAQAAGAKFAYIGYDPAAPEAEAIVVPKDSPIKSVAELKGKRSPSTRAAMCTTCWSSCLRKTSSGRATSSPSTCRRPMRAPPSKARTWTPG